jgi:hypothetical protein
VLGEYLKGLLGLDRAVGAGIQKRLGGKWVLWPGKVAPASPRRKDLDRRIDHFTAPSYPCFPRRKRAVRKLGTYSANNRAFMPHYGQRGRNGEPMAPAFVESTVNSVLSQRSVKKQSM